jgi:hypothetical protein
MDPGGFKLRQRTPVSARARAAELPPGLERYLQTAGASLAEPFKGITTNGHVVPGLFPIQTTGISTRILQEAARAFLAALGAEQKARGCFPLDSDAWRRWSNIHPFLMRHGVALEEMSPRGLHRGLSRQFRAALRRARLR